MMRGNELRKWNILDEFVERSELLKINVFTSPSCTFCSEALDIAQKTAGKFKQFEMPIEVVETSVEDKPEIVEALNVIALPMIMIGKSQIIGLPDPEDIELLLLQEMLDG